MDLPARVLIGGGSGFVGTELTKELRRKGYEVIVLSRKAGEFRMTWDELYQKGIPERTAAIVNLTGQNVLDPLRRWNEDFKKTVRFLKVSFQFLDFLYSYFEFNAGFSCLTKT